MLRVAECVASSLALHVCFSGMNILTETCNAFLVGVVPCPRPPQPLETHASNLWETKIKKPKNVYSSLCSLLGLSILSLLKYESMEILLNVFRNSYPFSLTRENNFFLILAAFKLLLLKTWYTKALFAEILCMHIHVFSGTGSQVQELYLEYFSDLLKTKQSSSTSEYRKEARNQQACYNIFLSAGTWRSVCLFW